MKAIICLAAIIAVAVAYPAQEGAAYTNEAIRQAQTSHLIPQNAQIQKVCFSFLTYFSNFILIYDLNEIQLYFFSMYIHDLLRRKIVWQNCVLFYFIRTIGWGGHRIRCFRKHSRKPTCWFILIVGLTIPNWSGSKSPTTNRHSWSILSIFNYKQNASHKIGDGTVKLMWEKFIEIYWTITCILSTYDAWTSVHIFACFHLTSS